MIGAENKKTQEKNVKGKVKMNSERKNKGITLIALVITIIVLLILAAISIATLTGNNGILTRAKDAKETNEYKAAEEKVKLSVMGAKSKDNGELKVTTLRTEVENSYSGTVEGNSFPVQVTIDQKTFTINGDGNLTNDQKKSLEEVKEIIESEKKDCMIDENGKIIPINVWKYEIIEDENSNAIGTIKGKGNTEYSDAVESNAYNGQVLSDGTLEYNIPVFIKENNNIYEVKEVGNWALYEIEGLISVDIPSGITNIGQGAFEHIKKLENINIPSTLTSIGSYAFYGCESLKKIKIPSSVIKLGEGVFRECENLSNVTFENKEGWTVKNWTSDPEISVNVDDPAINAKNLTDTYHLYEWNRK